MTAGAARPIRVAMIGHGFMGAAHAQAWRTAHRFFDLDLHPVPVVVAGRDPVSTQASANRLGWQEWSTDWRRVVERDDIDLVDICSPGAMHEPVALAALAAGKHVICEKPLANSVDQAVRMTRAARAADQRGVRSMVAFNYRRVPAVALARDLVRQGRIGDVRQVRAAYLQDWLTDPSTPMSWRMRRSDAGSGSLGDIAAHAVDLAQYLVGDLMSTVSGQLTTFVRHRPYPDGSTGEVTVDDAASFLTRFCGGATGVVEASRVATGRKNQLVVEIFGTDGALRFDLERLNELEVVERTVLPDGPRRVLVTEASQPYVGAWWPPGHVLGWEHTFVHQVADLLRCIANGVAPTPSFADGLQVQRVLAAVERSAHHGSWADVDVEDAAEGAA